MIKFRKNYFSSWKLFEGDEITPGNWNSSNKPENFYPENQKTSNSVEVHEISMI